MTWNDGSQHRLLFVTDDFAGGTGTHLSVLAARLVALGWAVHIVCYGAVQAAEPSGVAFFNLAGRGRLAFTPVTQIRRARQLRKLVASWRPDILHTFFFWSIIYGRYLKRSAAIEHLVENREDLGFNLSSVDYLLLRATASLPDRVVCVSQAVKDAVVSREALDPEKATVIANGVPPAPRTLRSLDALRKELGIRPGQPVVGMVANLNREVKGVNYFIEAVPSVLDCQPDTHFLIVGDGHLRPGLEEQARKLGVQHAITFAGFRKDIHDLYPLMDISALTSLSEGLSITILESMQHGLPVVATRVGGNAELVIQGETGLLVPPRDPEAFAREVGALLKDDGRRGQMSKNSLRRSDIFRMDDVAKKYSDLYCGLI